MKIRISISVFLFFLITQLPNHPIPCFANKAGTTGASFLKIPVGPRPSAMAGAYCAVSDDIYGDENNIWDIVIAGDYLVCGSYAGIVLWSIPDITYDLFTTENGFNLSGRIAILIQEDLKHKKIQD